MRKIWLGLLKKMKFLPPKNYVKIYYEYYSGKKLDLQNPIEFNQKIHWLKVFYKPSILTQLVDKYEVRSYVEEKIGKQYLNELIAVYEKTNQVDFEALPKKFVMKATHGFHFNIIVKDKEQLNKTRAKYLLRKWMGKNQYYRGGLEWAYKNVKPRIIVEKFLEEIGKPTVNDYKFFCFSGKPKFVQIDMERGIQDLRCYYDLDWQKLPFTTQQNKFFEGSLEKPKNFELMVDLAAKLADNFPFVRVDFYNIEGTIYFGEMTFYPTDGRKEFIPQKYNQILGSYIELPKVPKGQKFITEA
ncbi:ATP-grasp fold amidoligase family protein [Allomuricauda sp. SCSIO 65647]|uniref:ATP-grasp fold amidoligase family protein n=1 Tax=Allomuricauda sp. SCSIO 65647 TaxID=2908843 RepID=UPI001F20DD44|nr:ATP-grasp fold amidoligase family protein [Muricauda sp. SCSIO 65647]UJH66828.1 glycosyltransferase [Muricauda sp. SCSIO 65647]